MLKLIILLEVEVIIKLSIFQLLASDVMLVLILWIMLFVVMQVIRFLMSMRNLAFYIFWFISGHNDVSEMGIQDDVSKQKIHRLYDVDNNEKSNSYEKQLVGGSYNSNVLDS